MGTGYTPNKGGQSVPKENTPKFPGFEKPGGEIVRSGVYSVGEQAGWRQSQPFNPPRGSSKKGFLPGTGHSKRSGY